MKHIILITLTLLSGLSQGNASSFPNLLNANFFERGHVISAQGKSIPVLIGNDLIAIIDCRVNKLIAYRGNINDASWANPAESDSDVRKTYTFVPSVPFGDANEHCKSAVESTQYIGNGNGLTVWMKDNLIVSTTAIKEYNHTHSSAGRDFQNHMGTTSSSAWNKPNGIRYQLENGICYQYEGFKRTGQSSACSR